MPTFEELTAMGATPVAPAGVPASSGAVSFEQLQQMGATPVPGPAQPTSLASFGRGAVQGLSFGFGDEIAGAINSLFHDQSYSVARDETRAKDTAAREAHTGAYMGGELAGAAATSLVPGVGVARGASIAQAAGKTGLQGAAAALGSSKADLTKGNFKDAIIDTVEGAAAGAALGAVTQTAGKVIGKVAEKAKPATVPQLDLPGIPAAPAAVPEKAAGMFGGLINQGGLAGAAAMLAHGNLPGAAGALLLPKAGQVGGKLAVAAASKAAQVMETLQKAAAAGNPWAKAQLAAIEAVRGGASQELGHLAGGGASGVSPAATAAEPSSPGLLEPGNIDLLHRPRVKNSDGSISTVRSLGVNVDGVEVLIPTVSEDGRIMSDDEAIAQYKRTGRHLGKFASVAASNAYAEQLHEDQAAMIGE